MRLCKNHFKILKTKWEKMQQDSQKISLKLEMIFLDLQIRMVKLYIIIKMIRIKNYSKEVNPLPSRG